MLTILTSFFHRIFNTLLDITSKQDEMLFFLYNKIFPLSNLKDSLIIIIFYNDLIFNLKS